MKYTIFHVDESRRESADEIRRRLPEWKEVHGISVDGRIPEQLELAKREHPYTIHPNQTMGWPKTGHLGCWYGMLNALREAPIVTFDDDAVLSRGFHYQWTRHLDALPDDFDFFAMYKPTAYPELERPRHHIGDKAVCRLWQPNGGVSFFFSSKGAGKIFDLVKRDGLTMQVDNTLANYSWRGELNGYGLKYFSAPMVTTNDQAPSIAQETEYHGTSQD